MTYDPIYAESIADPAGFWMKAAEAIDWDVAPTRAGDPQDDGMWRWFPDGRLNTCHNALDRHVAAGRGDRVALVHDSAMTGSVTRFTYAELRDEVARVAGMIAVLPRWLRRAEEHTSELQSLMRISYAVFCLKKKTKQ